VKGFIAVSFTVGILWVVDVEINGGRYSDVFKKGSDERFTKVMVLRRAGRREHLGRSSRQVRVWCLSRHSSQHQRLFLSDPPSTSCS